MTRALIFALLLFTRSAGAADVTAFLDAGAGLLLGSDTPMPGFSRHHELDRLEAAGLTPAQALTTGTASVARYFDAEQWFGRVEAGLSADPVLLEDNPLENLDALRQPVGFVARGQWHDRATLDARLGDIADRAAGRGD